MLPRMHAIGAGRACGASVVYIEHLHGRDCDRFGWMLFYCALRGMSAGMTSLGTMATPIFVVLCAWWQLGERLSAFEASGMLLIAVCLSLLAWNRLRANARTEAV
jgi:drug/metabolite transporter (DMT)-like permease